MYEEFKDRFGDSGIVEKSDVKAAMEKEPEVKEFKKMAQGSIFEEEDISENKQGKPKVVYKAPAVIPE